MADITTINGEEHYTVTDKNGRKVNIPTSEFAEEWHVGHPDDELPPRRARTKTEHIAMLKAAKVN